MSVFFIYRDYQVETGIIRFLSLLTAFVSSLRQAVRLQIERPKLRVAATWSAHALNERHLGGVSCNGELGSPAVASLVG